MAIEYLLAAEADRIQDLIFRSASLREVVGGSQLLSRFNAEVPTLFGIKHENIITSGGGSFYLKFQDKNEARQFGAKLAEVYHRVTGGTLSVAEPVIYPSEAYGTASQEAGKRLREAKQQGGLIATQHIPFMAICESCGIELAETHEKKVNDETTPHYLCRSCKNKIAERDNQSRESFLKPFYMEVVGDKRSYDISRFPVKAEDVAKLDERGYVAYIVADGDGMGEVFGNLTSDSQATSLSKAVDRITREALARAVAPLVNTMQQDSVDVFVPALPLILGGDDVFALVPAPWALAIASALCTHFQEQMSLVAGGLGIQREITMTAAVVFCKANYPYYLAHEIGEEHLSAAKKVTKALALETGIYRSSVDFEIVLGSQVQPIFIEGYWRPTLLPYFTGEDEAGWGISLSKLFKMRQDLDFLPARRRAQLRAIYDRERLPDYTGHSEEDEAHALEWNQALNQVLNRVERDWDSTQEHPLRHAIHQLGGYDLENWMSLRRSSEPDFKHGHAMLDLLRVWDWLETLPTAVSHSLEV